MEKITILTSPTSKPLKSKLGLLYSRIKNVILKTPILEEPLGNGPKSVLRSLIAGLEQLGVNYNYNPGNVKNMGKIVMVLSNIEALKQAIKLKRNKKIKYLLAGPNLVVFSSDFKHILASPEIDICLVPSKQVAKLYVNDNPSLINRTKIWYAGVDENYWKPLDQLKGRNAVIYFKNSSKKLCRSVENTLIKHGWDVIKIIYGVYDQKKYKKALIVSQFSVFLSRSESQGIAVAESWAMNVPTFVWNPKTVRIRDRIFTNISSSPYLSNRTGFEWEKIKDFDALLAEVEKHLKTFQPRKWVLSHMTDIKSAKLLLGIIKTLIV